MQEPSQQQPVEPKRPRGTGITVFDLWKVRGKVGKRWRFRVFDAVRRSRKTKDFDDKRKSDGEAWAKTTQARLRNGIESTGAVLLSTVADDFIADRTRQGCSEEYVTYMRQTFDLALAAGVRDLCKEAMVLRRAKAFIDGLTDRRYRKLPGEPEAEPERSGGEVSVGTRNIRIKHLRALGEYAVEHRLLNRNPFERLKPFKRDDTAKEVFLLPELRLMMRRGVDHEWFPFAAIAAYTGMRLHEITALRWESVKWKEKRIRVERGKGNKSRNTYLQPELAAILEPMAKTSGWVLPDAIRVRSNQGHMTDLKRFLRHCGITRGDRTIHSLRHSWTALSLACGVNDFLVQSWLGHSDPKITQTYAREQDMFVEAVRSWPRGELYGEFYLSRPVPAKREAQGQATEPQSKTA